MKQQFQSNFVFCLAECFYNATESNARKTGGSKDKLYSILNWEDILWNTLGITQHNTHTKWLVFSSCFTVAVHFYKCHVLAEVMAFEFIMIYQLWHLFIYPSLLSYPRGQRVEQKQLEKIINVFFPTRSVFYSKLFCEAEWHSFPEASMIRNGVNRSRLISACYRKSRIYYYRKHIRIDTIEEKHPTHNQ